VSDDHAYAVSETCVVVQVSVLVLNLWTNASLEC